MSQFVFLFSYTYYDNFHYGTLYDIEGFLATNKSMRITLSLTWHVILGSLIIIIIFFGAMTFAGYKLYQKVTATELAQKELARKQLEEKALSDAKAEILLAEQNRALIQAQTELMQAKNDAAEASKGVAETTKQLQTLNQKLNIETSKPKDIVISSNDLTPYTTGVVQIICTTKDGISSGSGALWNFTETPYAVVTNKHVVKDAVSCVVSITNSANNNIGIFGIKNTVQSFNQETDSAILTVGDSLSTSNVPIANYNYSIKSLPFCTSLVPVGSPMVIIGYPAYAKRDAKLTIETIGTFNVIYRTVTNGIISGYDTSMRGEANYFVSAKIDNGNSGGIALAKEAKGLCILGLPTWLSVGNYETQGLVQNINNILPKR